MNNRLLAILLVACLAIGAGGCASEAQRARNKREVRVPLQTGSNLQRRIIPSESETKSKKPKKKKEPKRDSPKPPAPEREPAEEESATPPDRFR